jgi:hypothetical protein
MITTGISLVDWSTASRLQTDLATLDSRSGEPKIDNLGLSRFGPVARFDYRQMSDQLAKNARWW